MTLRLLHSIGLTNLSDTEVHRFERIQLARQERQNKEIRMNNDDNLKRNLVPSMAIFVLLGAVFILGHIVTSPHVPKESSLACLLDTLREVGMGLIVAGAVGLVFERLAHAHLIGRALTDIEAKLGHAAQKQGSLLDNLEERVNRVGNEIVMTSGMLRNATKVGIEAVYNGREEDFHRDLARSIREAKGTVRIIGISLADVCGYWGGKSLIHEEVEARMKGPDPMDKFQILFSDPEGDGLRTRAKYEHPGMEFMETRAYRQTFLKIAETMVIAHDAIKKKKVEVRLYNDTPLCFLVITEDRLFVEHYHFASRGGQNLILSIKGKTGLFRIYEDHFEALWRDAKEPHKDKYALLRDHKRQPQESKHESKAQSARRD